MWESDLVGFASFRPVGVRTERLEKASHLTDAPVGVETGCGGWLEQGSNQLFAVLHSPQATQPNGTGVVFVPPFGWAELISHRARRHWATRLARAGFVTLRYDLPATGDSFGWPHDRGVFDAWVTSVGQCADFLRRDTAVTRVAVIGIGLGGLIASVAVSRGAEIDDLLLWGVPSRGRASLREMAALARMLTSDHANERVREDVRDGLDLAGFYVSDETRTALDAIDVSGLALPVRPSGRVLILARDGARPDAGLETPFAQAGMTVEVARSTDFGDLMTAPQDPLLRAPEATIDRSIAWLQQLGPTAEAATGTDPVQPGASPAVPRVSHLKRSVRRNDVVETIVPIAVDGLTTEAIHTRPTSRGLAPVTALLLGPGAIRRVGLHRMSVEIARRWAAQGVASVRFDLAAVGDAMGPADVGEDERPMVTSSALMSPSSSETVAQVIGELRAKGLLDRFATVGHCSGAYLAFHAAMGIAGAAGCISVNQPAISHSNDLYQAQMFLKLQQALRGGFVRRWRQNRFTLRELRWAREAVVHRLRVRGQEAPELRQRDDAILMLDTLAMERVPVTLLASRGTGVLDVLTDPAFPDLSRWPNLQIEHLPTSDSSYHALGLQRRVHAGVDAALARILEAPPVAGPPAESPPALLA